MELSGDMNITNRRTKPGSDKLNYANVEDEEDVDYENAPSTARHYNRQDSSGSRRHAALEAAEDLRSSDSSSDKMVFVQPIAHVSSEANKKVVNKVEKIQISKTRTQNESSSSRSQPNHKDVVYMSKQATVKEIPSTSSIQSASHLLSVPPTATPTATPTTTPTAPPSTTQSYSSTVTVTDNHSDSDVSDQFVTTAMQRTSPQRAIIRQKSKESEVHLLESLFVDTSKSLGKMGEVTSAVVATTQSTNTSNQVSQSQLGDHVRVENGHDISSDSMSDTKHSSHSSSLASLSNMVAPCGSTEDLDNVEDNVDNEVFPLIPDSPELRQPTTQETKHSNPGDLSEPIPSVLDSQGDTSDLMRDITMSLNEALFSIDEVMSRGSGKAKVSEPVNIKPLDQRTEVVTASVPSKSSHSETFPSQFGTGSCSSGEGALLEAPTTAVSRARVEGSSVLSYNEGRIAFNISETDSLLSKVCMLNTYFRMSY